MTIHIDSLVIEVTRRCQLTCEHCLRGDTQKIDLPLEYIDSLFKQIDYVGSLTITGGEPALVPDRINYIVESAKEHNVTVGSFYIATNGIIQSDSFILAIIKLWTYCEDNEASGVQISNDMFHDTEQRENRLEVFSFFSKRNENDYYDYDNNRGLILEGNCDFGARTLDREHLEVEVYDDTTTLMETEVYLNCKGSIIIGCDWSYDTQDNIKECHVDSFSSWVSAIAA